MPGFSGKKMRNAHAREAAIRGYDTLIARGKKKAYGSIWVFFEGFSKAWPNCIILAFKLLTRLIMNNFVAKNF